MSDPQEAATVLVVEDETKLADLFSHWLSKSHDVRTAYTGEDALELFDDDVDVVLLDRRMPGMTGDEVLERIRTLSSDFRAAMVTAVDPGMDIVEMDYDEYVVKPVDEPTLTATVEFLLELAEYDETQRKLHSKRLRRNVLEAEMNEGVLEDEQQFQQLQAEIESLESRLDDISEDLEVDEDEIERRL